MTSLKHIALSLLTALCVAACAETVVPSIEIDGQDVYSLDASGTIISIRVSTNQATWNVDLGEASSWISAGDPSGNSIDLAVTANKTTESRSADIVVYAPDSDARAAIAYVKVNQAGKELQPSMTISANAKENIPSDGATLDVEVTLVVYPDFGYTISENDWITVKKTDKGLQFVVARNEVDLARSADVTIFAPAEDAKVKKAFTISQAAPEIQYEEIDLSAAGNSNCYVISHRGPYSFDATVKGNGKASEGLAAPEALAPASAKLVWQSFNGMITAVSLEGNRVKFTAGRPRGNAVIAVMDSKGTIIWSWHIWHPKEEIQALHSATGFDLMNMNLGALSNTYGLEAYGLLYQWGRKDPFPGSPVASGGNISTLNVPVYDINGAKVEIKASSMVDLKCNYLAYAIANPTVCISNNAQYSKCRDWLQPDESNPALWGNPKGYERKETQYNNHGTKSYYDPCPVGWRVGPLAAFRNFTGSGEYAWVTTDSEGNAVNDDSGNMIVRYYWGEDSFDLYDYNQDGKINMSDWNNGWTFNLDKANGVHSYFPATTRYDGQYALLMGSMVGLWGNYWFNVPSVDSSTGNDSYLAYGLAFSIKDYNKSTLITVSPYANGSRADAFSVRCVKE